MRYAKSLLTASFMVLLASMGVAQASVCEAAMAANGFDIRGFRDAMVLYSDVFDSGECDADSEMVGCFHHFSFEEAEARAGTREPAAVGRWLAKHLVKSCDLAISKVKALDNATENGFIYRFDILFEGELLYFVTAEQTLDSILVEAWLQKE